MIEPVKHPGLTPTFDRGATMMAGSLDASPSSSSLADLRDARKLTAELQQDQHAERMEQIRLEAKRGIAVLKQRREREMDALRAERQKKREAFEREELALQTAFAARHMASQEALKELQRERERCYAEAERAERRVRSTAFTAPLVVEELD